MEKSKRDFGISRKCHYIVLEFPSKLISITTFDVTPIQLAASLVSLAALLAFVRVIQDPRTRQWLGPAADFWELTRRLLLPVLDPRLRKMPGDHYAVYGLPQREIVGTLDATPEQVEQLLWDAGARRVPLAALKTLRTGETEVGSWAFRDHPLASTQTHVVLFDVDGTTVIAVHCEYNALNPFAALQHYRGVEYSPHEGVEIVRCRLDEGVWVSK